MAEVDSVCEPRAQVLPEKMAEVLPNKDSFEVYAHRLSHPPAAALPPFAPRALRLRLRAGRSH